MDHDTGNQTEIEGLRTAFTYPMIAISVAAGDKRSRYTPVGRHHIPISLQSDHHFAGWVAARPWSIVLLVANADITDQQNCSLDFTLR
ncbi:hypothetical protein [Halocatena marina]|uniref:hypothetical protein n=1 Tax=Halocatena marina TaxID=2934937 RepID=UPI00200FF59D|nr:hypothetical protein [Halocatena marina]